MELLEEGTKLFNFFHVFCFFYQDISQELIFQCEHSLIGLDMIVLLQIRFVVCPLKFVEEDDEGPVLSLLDLFLFGVFVNFFFENV